MFWWRTGEIRCLARRAGWRKAGNETTADRIAIRREDFRCFFPPSVNMTNSITGYLRFGPWLTS
jgi:hypothetical protein